ncbi:MAG TPA: hypothetical protein VN285_00345 [Candidatus Deferrimicrobium sp.]|nr:hypothetical protein [Candidatus Deferrimicrobium sp.]
MITKKIKSERGVAALIALIMVGMLTLLGLAALSTSEDEISIAGNELHEMRAFYAAEAGLEKAASIMMSSYDTTGGPPHVLPSGTEDLNFCTVRYNVVSNGPATVTDLSNGTLAGLHATVRSFSLTSVAGNAADNSEIRLSQTFEAAQVPIYQFAAFYENDLEMAPGPDLTVQSRVHSNANLWVQSSNTLNIDSYVSSAGHIHHGRKGPGAVDNGDILVKNGSGTYVSMRDGGGWLESTDGHWYDTSVARWQGRVQDSAHGQPVLYPSLSVAAAGDAHKLIEPAGGNPDSYENKSTIKFIDRQAFQNVAGVWVNVTGAMIIGGVITFTDDKFYDARENEWVDCMELDVEKFYDQGYAPSSGVIYFSDQTSDFPALRVRNAAVIDSALTIASENPVYTLGNFNSSGKKPAAILSDALTFLSSAWDDTKSAGALNDRVAANTTVNASYVSGNVETTASDYNGGFENLARLLEKWNGKTLTWRGSAVCLWNSVQADEEWSYGSYYTDPIRNWAFDTDLDDPTKIPPAPPTVRVFQRIGWRQEYVGYEGS